MGLRMQPGSGMGRRWLENPSHTISRIRKHRSLFVLALKNEPSNTIRAANLSRFRRHIWMRTNTTQHRQAAWQNRWLFLLDVDAICLFLYTPYNEFMSLKEKIVFITGASSGIGAATALAFAGEGARLLLAARRAEKLADVAKAALERGAQAVHSFALDVRDQAAVETAIAGLPEAWRAIEVLVNNAGLSRGLEKLYTGKIEDWEEMIDTNVKGLLYVTRAVVPGMVERGSGHVINLGSTAGHLTYPNGAVYCASKAAVRSINDGLRMDLLGTPIRVTSVDPGMVKTDFSLVRFHGDEERAANVYKGVKNPLTGEDVADVILWVATRPAHVNIADVLLTPVQQANSLLFHRD
jgi:3-hydroxy acid dehydrogenase / malonic semialdehyde reductase